VTDGMQQMCNFFRIMSSSSLIFVIILYFKIIFSFVSTLSSTLYGTASFCSIGKECLPCCYFHFLSYAILPLPYVGAFRINLILISEVLQK
jgi:hypothetical protein